MRRSHYSFQRLTFEVRKHHPFVNLMTNPLPASRKSVIGLDDGAQACLRIIIRAINSVGNSHCEVFRRLELTTRDRTLRQNIELGVKFCHLGLVTLGKLEKLLALKSLEIVDPSVYHFFRPSQYLDADIVPSDSEVKGSSR
jgi:hypothetical protein